MKRLIELVTLWVIPTLLWVCIMALTAVMAVEWVAGCGETYIDANGVTHQHECVFIKREGNTKPNES
jgi:hypothetical protein